MRSLVTRARKALGSRLVEGFFETASKVGSLHPRANPERQGVTVDRDVAYRKRERARDGDTERANLLDVYRPADVLQDPSGKPLPIVFYVHGGGFRILSKDTHWVMALAFARRGYAVFNVNYRLAPTHKYPAGLEDVCDAYAWVLENAARYGADPSRIVLAGESAGANLVTSLTLALHYRRDESFAAKVFATGALPKAVLPACGVFQVSDTDRFARRKPGFSAFLADRLREVEHGYLGEVAPGISLDLADPLVMLERGVKPDRPLPPFFLPVGTKDPLLDDTRRLAQALEALEVPVEAEYYEGEVHAFHAFVMRKAARQCWADTFSFLARHGIGPTRIPVQGAR
jgi:acetyl esterase